MLKKYMDTADNRHAYLFMLEVIVAIGIFVITASIIVMLFVRAKDYDMKTRDIHEANAYLTNLAEQIRLYDSSDQMESKLTEAGFEKKDDTHYEYVDRSYTYFVDLKNDDGLVDFNLACFKGKHEIIKLDVEHYIGDMR
jgi:type II secretory pathway pseudopilin PulG